MLESVKRLRAINTIGLTTGKVSEVCNRIADAIEREVAERYVEGPTDKNGDPITFSAGVVQWGALDMMWCEVYPDGTHEWFVRGHDVTAPV